MYVPAHIDGRIELQQHRLGHKYDFGLGTQPRNLVLSKYKVIGFILSNVDEFPNNLLNIEDFLLNFFTLLDRIEHLYIFYSIRT